MNHSTTHRRTARATALSIFLGLGVFAPQLLPAAGFTVSGATVTLMGNTIVSTIGDATLSSGQLNAGAGLLLINGDWTMAGGSFVASASTVVFQGVVGSTSTLTGSTTFNTLACTTPGKRLVFPILSTQTVQGSFIISGSSTSLVSLRSSSAGTYAYLLNSGTNTVSDVDVMDNNAVGGNTILALNESVDEGHTVNWVFGAPGSSSANVFVSSISVLWSTLPAALGYVVDASTANNFGGVLTSTFTLNGLLSTLPVTGLTPDTTYYLRVGGLYIGATDYADVGPVSTLTLPLASAQVGTVLITSATVNWPALIVGQGYRLEASTSSTFSSIVGSSATADITLSTLTVQELSAHTTYYLRVGGVNWQGVANFDILGTIQTNIGGPPLLPVINTVTSNAAKVSWVDVPFATGYDVEASTSSSFVNVLSSTASVDTTATSLAVGANIPLTPDTTFFIRAGALYNGATAYTLTLSTPTLTSAITGGQFENIFLSSITVNWDPLLNAQGYRVDASTAPDFSGVQFSTSTTNLSASTLTVTGLVADTDYYVRVGGINWSGALNDTPIGSATAGVGVSPQHPIISAASASSITTGFGTATGANGYVTQASTAADFSGSVFSSVTANSQSVSLSALGLTTDTTYYMRVGALYGGATSYAVTTPLSTSTLSSAVTNVHITGVSSSTLSVQWSTVTDAQGYKAEASVASDFSAPIFSSTTLDSTDGSIVIGGLTQGTTYFVRVGGLNWDGVSNPVSGGSALTLGGQPPNSPVISAVYVTSITVTYGTIAGADGYRLEASQSSDFSGTIFSSTTADGNMFRLTVTGLSANSQYYMRVASLWNGEASYAATVPPFAITNPNSGTSSVGPKRPETIRGQLLNGGADFQLTWRPVIEDINGNPTTIASYSVARSSAIFGVYTPLASVTGTTASDTVLNQTYFYRVVAVDGNGNTSAPSDEVDSSPNENRYIQPGDGTDTDVVIPDTLNQTLQSNPNGSQDIALVLTRRTGDEGGVILRSYDLSAYFVTTGQTDPTFTFPMPGMVVSLDYAGAITSASEEVSPYWINGGEAIRLANPVQASAAPLNVSAQNIGVYQVRTTDHLGGFALQSGSPYPRTLTPNRPNENRKLFFLFTNPNNDPVSISIYDIRDRKVRDLDPSGPTPIPGAMVWDVKDDSGRIVPSGIYLYKISAGKKTITGSVVVAR